MTTLFISDLHLEDRRPETTRLFLAFIEAEAAAAGALYILGDLFEYWIGDDAVGDTAGRVADALSRVASQGLPIYFMPGNRDFLLGPRYAEMAGMRLLADPTVVDIDGLRILLMHGDSLCTDDVQYQAFRQQVRNPDWQTHFLSLPVGERVAMAQQARDASKTHTGTAPMAIMDVNHQAVLNAFRTHDVRYLIHGHTHRPKRHRIEQPDSDPLQRIVLGDWYAQSSILRISDAQFDLRSLNDNGSGTGR